MKSNGKMPEWLTVKSSTKYADRSERTVRTWLKNGLRHCKLPSGSILIKREWLDQYIEQYEVKKNKIDQIVEEIFNK